MFLSGAQIYILASLCKSELSHFLFYVSCLFFRFSQTCSLKLNEKPRFSDLNFSIMPFYLSPILTHDMQLCLASWI